MVGTDHCDVNVAVTGAFGIAVTLDNACDYNCIDITKTTLGSSSKVFYNGSSVYTSQGNATVNSAGSTPNPAFTVGSTTINATTNVIRGIM